MRKLDVFNHIWPTRFYEALRAHTSGPMQDITRRSEAVPMMTQLDVRFRVMDLFGPDYQQILSLASPLLDLATNAEQGRRLARIGNEDGRAMPQARGSVSLYEIWWTFGWPYESRRR